MRRLAASAALVLLCGVVPVSTAGGSHGPTEGDPRHGDPHEAAFAGHATPRAAGVLDELEDQFVTTRPDLGPTWVVSLPGSTADRLTLRTLQGVVNATEVRMYLVGSNDGSQALLDAYVARGDVTVAGSLDFAGALDMFAHEAGSFMVADLSEPWSVHAAAAIAQPQGAIVTTATHVAGLEARGLTQLDDVSGRWADEAEAYADIAALRDDLASEAIAVISASDTLWDFTHQQGILTVFTRPTAPSWPTVSPIILDTAPGQPVWGYIAANDLEEALGVATLSSAGLLLVPTDTTRNLSFHIAVGAERARSSIQPLDPDTVEPCGPETLNVVVALSDGDNLNVPLNHFWRSDNWLSPARGDLALGWSITPTLATLAPGAWDLYVEGATGNDELVAMIGTAYAAPALLPDAESFYTSSFRAMEALGMSTFWSLGGALDTPESSYWALVDDLVEEGPPTGFLVSYGNGIGGAYHSPGGLPAFTSRSEYGQTPADMEAHVATMLATPPDERPLVLFLSASNWHNPAQELIERLAPFVDQGVRFLTPAEASACMPDAPPPPPAPVDPPRACLPHEPITHTGLELISVPAANEIRRVPTRLDLPTTVTATAAAEPGGRIDIEATVLVDLDAFAEAIFDTRVHPVIESGYGSEIADEAWLQMVLDDLVTTFPLAAGTTALGEPSATSTGAPVEVALVDGAVSMTFGRLVGEANVPPDQSLGGEPVEVVVSWSVEVAEQVDDWVAPVTEGEMRFSMDLTIGLSLSGITISGGVLADWSCQPGTRVLATTAVAGTGPPDGGDDGDADGDAGVGDDGAPGDDAMAPDPSTVAGTPGPGGRAGPAGAADVDDHAPPATPVGVAPQFTG
jgi:hypothetical protein